MKKIISNFKNSLWGGAISLSIGSVISQGINVLIQPILTRLITPEQLGEYSYILSIANLFMPIASLNLHLLIVTAKNEKELKKYIDLSIYAIFLTILIYLVGMVITLKLRLLESSSMFHLLILIPLVILTNGIYQVYLSEDNWYQKYHNMTFAEITKIGLMSFIQVLAGVCNWGTTGLVMGKIGSPTYYVKRSSINFFQTIKNFKFSILLEGVKKNWQHIIYSVPSQFLNTFSYSLIMISIVSLFSKKEVGYYSISTRVLGVPILLISYNLSKVYLKRISSHKNAKLSLFKIYLDTVKKLTIISTVIFLIISILGPLATELIFGTGYKEAGIYISILCLMFSVRLVASSLSSTFLVLEKQEAQFYLNLVFIFLGILSHIFTYIYNLDIYHYLLFISVSYSISYGLNLLYIGVQCKKWDNRNLV
ncbi:lipopolysaccharide biosynthesis protein [Aerococcus viridans]